MSSGKVMAFISLEAEEVLLVDYLDKGRTITRAYYADRLRQLRGKNQTESSWKADKRSALLPWQYSGTHVHIVMEADKGSALLQWQYSGTHVHIVMESWQGECSSTMTILRHTRPHRHGKLTRGVLFYHDNTPAHTSTSSWKADKGSALLPWQYSGTHVHIGMESWQGECPSTMTILRQKTSTSSWKADKGSALLPWQYSGTHVHIVMESWQGECSSTMTILRHTRPHRHGKLTRGVLFYHDNTPAHTSTSSWKLTRGVLFYHDNTPAHTSTSSWKADKGSALLPWQYSGTHVHIVMEADKWSALLPWQYSGTHDHIVMEADKGSALLPWQYSGTHVHIVMESWQGECSSTMTILRHTRPHRHGKLTRGVLFYHDNTPAHTSTSSWKADKGSALPPWQYSGTHVHIVMEADKGSALLPWQYSGTHVHIVMESWQGECSSTMTILRHTRPHRHGSWQVECSSTMTILRHTRPHRHGSWQGECSSTMTILRHTRPHRHGKLTRRVLFYHDNTPAHTSTSSWKADKGSALLPWQYSGNKRPHRHGKLTRGVLFYHDNTPAHTSTSSWKADKGSALLPWQYSGTHVHIVMESWQGECSSTMTILRHTRPHRHGSWQGECSSTMTILRHTRPHRHGKLTRGVLFYHDNTPAHTSTSSWKLTSGVLFYHDNTPAHTSTSSWKLTRGVLFYHDNTPAHTSTSAWKADKGSALLPWQYSGTHVHIVMESWQGECSSTMTILRHTRPHRHGKLTRGVLFYHDNTPAHTSTSSWKADKGSALLPWQYSGTHVHIVMESWQGECSSTMTILRHTRPHRHGKLTRGVLFYHDNTPAHTSTSSWKLTRGVLFYHDNTPAHTSTSSWKADKASALLPWQYSGTHVHIVMESWQGECPSTMTILRQQTSTSSWKADKGSALLPWQYSGTHVHIVMESWQGECSSTMTILRHTRPHRHGKLTRGVLFYHDNTPAHTSTSSWKLTRGVLFYHDNTPAHTSTSSWKADKGSALLPWQYSGTHVHIVMEADKWSALLPWQYSGTHVHIVMEADKGSALLPWQYSGTHVHIVMESWQVECSSTMTILRHTRPHRHGKLTRGVLCYHDNTPAHTSTSAWKADKGSALLPWQYSGTHVHIVMESWQGECSSTMTILRHTRPHRHGKLTRGVLFYHDNTPAHTSTSSWKADKWSALLPWQYSGTHVHIVMENWQGECSATMTILRHTRPHRHGKLTRGVLFYHDNTPAHTSTSSWKADKGSALLPWQYSGTHVHIVMEADKGSALLPWQYSGTHVHIVMESWQGECSSTMTILRHTRPHRHGSWQVECSSTMTILRHTRPHRHGSWQGECSSTMTILRHTRPHRHGKLTRGVLFHHDNTPAHTSTSSWKADKGSALLPWQYSVTHVHIVMESWQGECSSTMTILRHTRPHRHGSWQGECSSTMTILRHTRPHRHGKLTRGVLFYHDNTPAHTSTSSWKLTSGVLFYHDNTPAHTSTSSWKLTRGVLFYHDNTPAHTSTSSWKLTRGVLFYHDNTPAHTSTSSWKLTRGVLFYHYNTPAHTSTSSWKLTRGVLFYHDNTPAHTSTSSWKLTRGVLFYHDNTPAHTSTSSWKADKGSALLPWQYSGTHVHIVMESWQGECSSTMTILRHTRPHRHGSWQGECSSTMTILRHTRPHRHGKLTRGVLFYHDNTPAHTSTSSWKADKGSALLPWQYSGTHVHIVMESWQGECSSTMTILRHTRPHRHGSWQGECSSTMTILRHTRPHRHGKLTRGVLFYHDNTPAHTSTSSWKLTSGVLFYHDNTPAHTSTSSWKLTRGVLFYHDNTPAHTSTSSWKADKGSALLPWQYSGTHVHIVMESWQGECSYTMTILRHTRPHRHGSWQGECSSTMTILRHTRPHRHGSWQGECSSTITILRHTRPHRHGSWQGECSSTMTILRHRRPHRHGSWQGECSSTMTILRHTRPHRHGKLTRGVLFYHDNTPAHTSTSSWKADKGSALLPWQYSGTHVHIVMKADKGSALLPWQYSGTHVHIVMESWQGECSSTMTILRHTRPHRHGKLTRGVLFYHDNTPAHTSTSSWKLTRGVLFYHDNTPAHTSTSSWKLTRGVLFYHDNTPAQTSTSSWKLTRRVLFYHDNTPAHTSTSSWKADKGSALLPWQYSGTHVHIVMESWQGECSSTMTILRHTRPHRHESWQGECSSTMTILRHTRARPYSPDLAPSDYYLFPKIQKELGGNYFAIEGIRLFHEPWTRCVTVGGDYVNLRPRTYQSRLMCLCCIN